jgi:hypothetical protein
VPELPAGCGTLVRMADAATTTSTPARVLYAERLTAPASWWAISVLVCGASLGAILLKLSGVAGAVGAVVGVLIGTALVAGYGRIGIELTERELRAGPAAVPVAVLGPARALDAEEARSLRMERSDARAFMLLRSYLKAAVLVEVNDPEDPTPYLYLSTRHPKRVVAAVEQVRRQGQ